MARQYKTGFIITGDASGGIKAIKATESELAQLNKGFDRAGNKAQQFAKRTNDTGRELEFLRNTAVGVGAALAGAFAIGNLRGQAQMIAQTNALANSLQMSTSQLQAWTYAGQQVGIQGDKIGDIFKDVSDKLGDFVTTGGGEAADLFETLNLNVREMRRLSPDQQLLKIGEALSQIGDANQRVFFLESIADDASRLMPLLEDNARLLREYTAEARSLGVAMDEVDIQAAVDAERSMLQLGAAVEGVSNQLLADLGPGLALTTQQVTDFIQEAGGAEEVLQGVMSVAGALATVYLARRLGPGLLSVGKTGFAAGTQIAQGMAIAVGASGRLNQALVVTQGRIAATAAAGRALSGAMTLLGGPAGVAILAAGAIYTFREELGLTTPALEASSEAVATLTGRLDNMNQAAAELQLTTLIGKLAELKAQAEVTGEAYLDVGRDEPINGGGFLGVDVSGQVEQFREISEATSDSRQEFVNVEAAIGLVESRLQELKAQGERTVPTLSNLGSAAEEAEKAAKKQAQALEQLRREIDPLRAEHAEYTERVGVLNQALIEGTIAEREYGEAVRWSAQQYVDAATGAEEYEKRLESLIDKFDAQHLKAEQLEQSLAAINAAYRAGDIDGEQYQRMVANVHEQMRDLALESDPLAQEMARAWTEAADRIDETFADAFAGVFDSFDDFAAQLMDGFKRLLAELAYQATLKPIVVQLTGQMQGVLGIGGQGGGLVGGGGGGFGSMLSTGRQLYNGVTKGFGNIAWTGASNAGGLYSNVATGSLYDSIATGGVQSGGLWGGSTSNFTGMNGLASAGAGFVGSYAGNAVGESLFDKQANSSWGRTAGTVIGTYFGGPIGAGIGSFIGGLVDTAFGSGREYGFRFLQDADNPHKTGANYGYDTSVGDGTPWYSSGNYANGDLGRGRTTAFGSYGFLSKEVVEPKDMIAFLDSLEQIDNTLAAVMDDDQVARIKSTLDGYYYKGDSMRDVMRARLNVIIDQSNSAFESAIESMGGGIEAQVQALATGLQIEDVGAEIARAVAADMNREFRRALRGGGDIEAVAQRLLVSAQAVQLLGDSVERLHLRFDETSAGALAAAGDLQALVGGVQSLAGLQSQYYQAMFSDAERLANLEADLAEQFDAMGMDLPTTTDAFRDLVEMQNLMTEAGREQYAALLALVPAMDQYLNAMEGQQAQYEQLSNFLDDLLLSNQSTLDPSERLQESQAQYAQLQVLAEAGDADAINQLASAAQAYLEEATVYYGQGSAQYASIFDDIVEFAQGLLAPHGSHAAGLASVPFDGYRAELHAGETVLPAPIAQLYRESAPGNRDNAELLAELRALRDESRQLRGEVAQLRSERGRDAERAAGQRSEQIREAQKINRNTKTSMATV
ncbi:hypothetical protein SAMN05661010_02510 [Modicisalibacter muralis]|uniref:Prophage tail length tape measure protein n=1 Tax=Modicisalibacter muralis TaxID=119000 RepID=A0A1G9MU57_9GAMM|nr:hypothetical protein [Halomonas muralis]SDL77457.1 hypothetical protein SAMN05661010_02510 [Halomonas muralis]